MINQEKVFETLQSTETNWTVRKSPLVSLHESTDGISELPTKSYGIFRSDNNDWLGTVGERYELMQNHELADIVVGIQEQFGGKLSGGFLQDGRKIFYQISLADEHVNSDRLKRFITCLNSHDGSSSIGFGSSNTVVSCSNTFHMAMKELSRFRHTTTAQDRLKRAVDNFVIAMESDKNLMDKFKRFSDVVIDRTIIERVMSNVFKVDMNTKESEVGTRKKNQISDFEMALNKETTEKGGTLWGLFNAVTYYTNHLDSRKSDYNLMIGSGYRKNLTAFKVIDSYEQEKRTLIHA
jgi:phage/plasmid-like protein (TIGR03299 family)